MPAAYVDMSGDVNLKTRLHNLMQDNMVESCLVGVSHWENRGDAGALPGAKPSFFFAPGRIAKRDKEWGPGIAWSKAMAASAEVATTIKDDLELQWVHGTDELSKIWLELLDNNVPANRGLMVSLV